MKELIKLYLFSLLSVIVLMTPSQIVKAVNVCSTSFIGDNADAPDICPGSCTAAGQGPWNAGIWTHIAPSTAFPNCAQSTCSGNSVVQGACISVCNCDAPPPPPICCDICTSQHSADAKKCGTDSDCLVTAALNWEKCNGKCPGECPNSEKVACCDICTSQHDECVKKCETDSDCLVKCALKWETCNGKCPGDCSGLSKVKKRK